MIWEEAMTMRKEVLMFLQKYFLKVSNVNVLKCRNSLDGVVLYSVVLYSDLVSVKVGQAKITNSAYCTLDKLADLLGLP